MKLILFDIDGTLLYSKGNGKKALVEAAETVFGREVDTEVSMAGKTDPLIVYELVSKFASREHVLDKLPDVFQQYLGLLKSYYTVERGVGVFDGVNRLLDKLFTMTDGVTGLLTGNIHRGAMIKLGTLGIEHYFKLGAFGDDGFYRKELPDVAVQRAFDLTGRAFSGKDIVIIGDTVHDVECGRHLGVKSIAVCTNKSTEEDLRASNPDFFFHSFEETNKVLEAIFD